MNTTTGAGAQAERSKDPLEEAFRTLDKMELDTRALDPAISLASIAISMKRIADSLINLHSALSYDSNKTRDSLRDQADKITSAVMELRRPRT